MQRAERGWECEASDRKANNWLFPLGIGQDRRSQIRRAQRTYRLRKETTLQELRLRVAELERTLGTVSGLVEDLHEVAAGEESLSLAHRTLLDQIRVTARQGQIVDGPRRESRENMNVDVFGYQVSHVQTSVFTSTYSHQERTLARRLHRISLEQTYAWFRDRSTSPAWIVRVFGLLPCLPQPDCVERTYQRVLRGGIDDSLEVLVMPFYGIGGAGTHYPRRDAAGSPVYPENMREPKRILNRAVGGMLGREYEDAASESGRQRQLQRLGFDGDWFDCHDVQGYLESLGITLDGTSRLLRSGTETSRFDLEKFLTGWFLKHHVQPHSQLYIQLSHPRMQNSSPKLESLVEPLGLKRRMWTML